MSTGSFSWELTAYQKQGHLFLSWSTTAPFRAQQGQISVYNNSNWPSNPQDDRKAWSWDNENNHDWDTGLPWGSDWYCAWIAEKSPNGPYTYVTQLITVGKSDPAAESCE